MNGVLKKLLCLGSIIIGCLGTGVAQSSPLNPGFETGDFTDWGFLSEATVVSDNGPSAPGTFAVSMTPGGAQFAVSKAIPISVGQPVDFSFDYKTLAGATGDMWVLLRYWRGVGDNGFSDGGGGAFRAQHIVAATPTNGAWLTSTSMGLPYPTDALSLISPPDYVDIQFTTNTFVPFSGTELVDNFNVNIVPEPTTLSLLCLGGIALLFHHRKHKPSQTST